MLISSCSLNSLFALDWVSLHEKADQQNLDSAGESLRAEPLSIDRLYILGLVFLNLHKDAKAKEVFSRILMRNPDIIEAKWGLAEALRRQHKIDQAENLLNEVIIKAPDFSPAYISLAYVKYIRMNFQESARLALKVIQQGRKNVDLSNYVRAYAMYAGAKGMIAHYGGPLSKAVNGLAVKPNLQKAQKLQPDSPAVLFGLGSYYFLAPVIAGGDKSKAEVLLKKTIEVDPLFADAYVRLAQLYRVKGDEEKYSFYMNKVIEIDAKNVLFLDHMSGECKFICVGGQEEAKP